jgi:hypothetical protein
MLLTRTEKPGLPKKPGWTEAEEKPFFFLTLTPDSSQLTAHSS